MSWLGDIGGWFSSAFGFLTNPDKAISNWFSSIAGQIGSAIETGFTALFKDLWDVIVGPLELLAGAVIGFVAIGLLFRNDLVGFMGATA